MTRLIAFITLAAMLSCGTKRKEEVEFTVDQASIDDLKKTVVHEFQSKDSRYLSPRDSCFFVNTIQKYLTVKMLDGGRAFENLHITGVTCPVSGFSCSLLFDKNDPTKLPVYLGFRDIYAIKYMDLSSDSVRRFELPELTDVFLKLTNEIDKPQREVLVGLLNNLYFERLDQIPEPILKPIAFGTWDCKMVDCDRIEKLTSKDDVFYVIEGTGLLIFRILERSGKTSIDEVFAPFPNRPRWFKTDVLPEELNDNCY